MNMRNHVAALLVALSATTTVGEATFPAAMRRAGALALDAGEAVPVRDGGRPDGGPALPTAAWAAALGRLRNTSLPDDAPALPAFLKADSVSANATARNHATIIFLPRSSPNPR